MRDLFNYIQDTANINFENMGLTEVDNVIFSRLAYLNLSAFTGKTIEYAAEHYQAREDDAKNIIRTKELLEALAKTKRFKFTFIEEVNEIMSEDAGSAFYAVKFKITKDHSYIAFRGTDERITSLYEDAELAYNFPIPSQIAALNFVKEAIRSNNDRLYIGGHSKGGNLALFSFIFLNETQRKKIVRTYNNDGPGFPKELVRLIVKPDIAAKITNLAPEDSIVGRMLETSGEYRVIKSVAVGVSQHNVFTWVVKGVEFETTKKFSLLSEYIEDTLTAGLNTASGDDMKKAAETIYRIAMNSNIKTTKDINPKNLKSVIPALIQIADRENNASDEMAAIIKILIKSLLDSIDIKKFITYSLPEEITEYANMDKEEIKQALAEKFRPDENGNSEVRQFFTELYAKYKEEKEAKERKKNTENKKSGD